GATEPLVVDRLPEGAWLMDLGIHRLRDLPRPEGLMRWSTPSAGNESPPLRTPKAIAATNLPVQLTSFVGRGAELAELRGIIAEHRLVRLTGAGGLGKTRLAIQVPAELAGGFGDAEDRQCYLVVGGDPASPTCCTRG